jgi:hypothetical protein
MALENCFEQNLFVFIKAIIEAINYLIYKILYIILQKLKKEIK